MSSTLHSSPDAVLLSTSQTTLLSQIRWLYMISVALPSCIQGTLCLFFSLFLLFVSFFKLKFLHAQIYVTLLLISLKKRSKNSIHTLYVSRWIFYVCRRLCVKNYLLHAIRQRKLTTTRKIVVVYF